MIYENGNLQYRNCWASSLGDCSDKISREHVVSKALFISDCVDIQGFKWCKEEPKRVGIQSATAKILCTTHNNGLSEIDTAAAAAFDAFRESTRLTNVRQGLAGARFRVERFRIDAPKLERWFLKTLINISRESELLIGPQSCIPGLPSDNLVNICFGKEKFQERAGMYVAANAGMLINSVDTLAFSPLVKDDSRILGGFFEFRGFRFFLCLMPEGLDIPLATIPRIGEHWANADLLWRFKKIKAKLGKSLSHVIEFYW